MRELSLQTYMCIYQWYRSNEAEAKAATVFFPLKTLAPTPFVLSRRAGDRAGRVRS
jgi:hypothetical protein